MRCFSFLDLCGFSDFVDSHGPERASGVLTAVRSSIRVTTSAFGVRVAKWLGDGALIVGVDTEDTLEATLEIRTSVTTSDIPLPLRGGVAAGMALVFEGDDYIGRPLNVAAKLCAMAARGEILAPLELATEHPGVLSISQEMIREVPGVAAPVALAAIEAVAGSGEGEAPPLSETQPA